MSHWTTDSGSVAILGHTQTGKTTLARQMHAENSRLSIWINGRGEDRVPNVHGERYESVDGVVRGMARDETKINLLSKDPKADVVTLQERMWGWAHRTDRQLQMQVVIDELHNVAPQSGKETLPPRDAVRKMAKEGQKRGIKFIGITQDPVSMDKQTLRQTEYTALFANHYTQETSLERLNLPFDDAQRLPEYHCMVIDAKGERIEEAIKAHEKYA